MEQIILKSIPTKELMEELRERMEMMNPIAVPLSHAAELCGVGSGTMREWLDNDPNFPAIKSGKHRILVPVDGLRAYIEARGKLRAGLKTHSSAVADIVMRNRRERA